MSELWLLKMQLCFLRGLISLVTKPWRGQASNERMDNFNNIKVPYPYKEYQSIWIKRPIQPEENIFAILWKIIDDLEAFVSIFKHVCPNLCIRVLMLWFKGQCGD